MADTPGLPLDPRLQAHLLDLMQVGSDRSARTEPIHQMAMAMASRMAPDYAQQAVSAPRARTDPASIAQPITSGATDSSGHPALTAGVLAAIAALIKAASGGKDGSSGNIPIQKMLDALKRLMQGGSTVQGNKPNPGGMLQGANTFDNTFAGWNDWGDTGMDVAQWPGGANPTPNVDTSWTFGGIPGGYGNNPEDPNSAAPDWASLLPSAPAGNAFADNGSGGGTPTGTNWYDE